jgi:hypothetical protein
MLSSTKRTQDCAHLLPLLLSQLCQGHIEHARLASGINCAVRPAFSTLLQHQSGRRTFSSRLTDAVASQLDRRTNIHREGSHFAEAEEDRPDAVLLRVVLVASVIGALYVSWGNSPGVFGSPSSHVMLLKGSSNMRIAGLQRLQRCAASRTFIEEFVAFRVPERLISMLRTESDLEVWQELCITVAAVCDIEECKRVLACSGLCAVLSRRLSTAEDDFVVAAEPLVQRIIHGPV